jgi:large subunit ribosomal protein L22
MEVIAKGKYIRLSPKKGRQIADLVRGKNAHESLNLLKSMPQGAAGIIRKVLASAMANAENNFNLDKDALVISGIMIDGGPVLKRWQPRAKGAAYEIKKRTSHVTVIVSGDVKTKKIAEKAEKKEKETTEDHKVEVERPEFLKKEKAANTAKVQNKIFRRKAGM